MATIRPFRALRYSNQAGPLDQLVAPPYDVLSPEERDELAAQSAHNVVHLTLPEQNADDRSKFVKYARSASRLQEWRAGGALALEEKPAYYRYRQKFTIPGDSQVHERLAVISLIKVEPYENGVVLPHEQTFPKHKEDRLRILEATRAHLECIYGLFEDPNRAIFDQIAQAPATTVSDVTTDDGVHHLVEKIDDEATLEAITTALAEKKVWIADGHHRYETACNFRAQQNGATGEIPEDYMMMALSSMSDPGLVLLPTHRILKALSISGEELKAKMSEHFDVSDCANGDLMASIEKIEAEGGRAFGVALPGGHGFVAKVRDLTALGLAVKSTAGQRLRELDVSILHAFIFEKLLGLTGLEFFGYTRDPQEAIDAVENGSPASFLMNPPTVDDMRAIALGGEKMPQKSTFYYPKILSGLAIWSLADF